MLALVLALVLRGGIRASLHSTAGEGHWESG